MAVAEELALSEAEIDSMLAAIDLGGPGAIDPTLKRAIVEYITGELAAELVAMNDALYEEIRRGITGPASPKAIEEAKAAAIRQTKKITGDLMQAQFNTIADTIARAVEAGDHPYKTARLLDEIKGLDRNRVAQYNKYQNWLDTLDLSEEEYNRRLETKFGRLLGDRKKTIAHNEIRLAVAQGQRADADARGARGKVWITTGDGRVSNGCQANEAAGVIPINKTFPSGDMQQPRFPGCRCVVSYMTSDAQQARAQGRVADRVAATKAAKDEAKAEAKAAKAAAKEAA